MKRTHLVSLAALALAGCALEPQLGPIPPAVPSAWPVGDAYPAAAAAARPPMGYSELLRDPRLRALVERALLQNQDLRAATANVAAARAQYRVQRSEQLPVIGASGGIGVSGSGTGSVDSDFGGGVAVSAFELDLFGRVRSLSRAALAEYLATEQGARAARISLVAEVAGAYLALAADRSLLGIAESTVDSAARSVSLAEARRKGGIAPRSDVRQAQTILAQAQSDRAELITAVAQDRNALELLVGGPVADSELPASMDAVVGSVTELSAGRDSAVLLLRPDVIEAEQRLRAANARIGAARAAFFPRISLSALADLSATALSALFSAGSIGWSADVSASLPIFDGGAASGNLALAQARREASLAAYQQTIRQAFREVADALARRGTIAAQVDARSMLVAAAQDNLVLEEARYREGIVPYLNVLDAQRTLYQARRSLVTSQLVRENNLVTLYRVLGNDRPAGLSAASVPVPPAG